MSWKTKIITISVIFLSSVLAGYETPIVSVRPLALIPSAMAETIEVSNPLEYNTVEELSSQIRTYLLMIVGGIAVIFIAIAGILYIIGGATGNDGMIEMGKKGIIGAIAGLVIILGAGMLINEIYFIVTGSQYSFEDLSASQILVRLINFLLAIVGTLFLISMLIGGIWYFAAGGDESKVEMGKKTIRYSLIGITIAVAAIVVLRQIDRLITGS